MLAHELAVPLELVVVASITETDPAQYAGNPALKLPSLRRDSGALVFGCENICRAIAESSSSSSTSLAARVVWPEQLRADLSRNAQELVWHAMSAQVQLVMGTVVNKLPADNAFFLKTRAGFEGALDWLDANVDGALAALPADRAVSLLELTLFALLEHLPFRKTLSLDSRPALIRFARAFGERACAQKTAYRFDA
jgi:glutathione S-transferase